MTQDQIFLLVYVVPLAVTAAVFAVIGMRRTK
jgi:hypothetical protein